MLSEIAWVVPRRIVVGLVLLCSLIGLRALSVASPGSGSSAPITSAHGLGSLPPAAREAISNGIGGAQPQFGIARTAAGVLRAHGGGVASTFGATGVRTTARSGASLRLGLLGLGRAGHLQALAAVAPTWRANRAGYRHAGADEWYANGPLGLEQGFTLTRRVAGSGPLTLVAGSVPSGTRTSLAPGGAALTLIRRGGSGLSYGDLRVTDAAGRQLQARIALAGSQLLLRIDDAGARYPLKIDPLVQSAQLTAADGAAQDSFGDSVAISGSTIVVGSRAHKVGSNAAQGAAYVFTETGSGSWAQTAELTASDGAASDDFGQSVAISGSTIVVGAPNHTAGQGAAYVFVRNSSGTWQQQSPDLLASDGTATTDSFGDAVAISGSTVVVGAERHSNFQGAAYVFIPNSSGVWQQKGELTVVGSFSLGYAVAVSGGTIVVGGDSGSIGPTAYSGSAYVFTANSSGVWQQSAKLISSDLASVNTFGTAVAISGSTIVVGDFNHMVGTNQSQGAAYVFVPNSSTGWAQSAELTAGNGAHGDNFGSSVSISGSTIAIGAMNANNGTGSVYQFAQTSSGGWQQAAEGIATSAVSPDALGSSVGISGSTIVAGAPNRMVGGQSFEGAAYVFPTASGSGTAVPVKLSPPKISGAATVGKTLTEAHGTWTNAPTSYRYQWQTCTSSGTSCSNVTGATGQTYKLTTGNAGHTIRVLETASNAGGAGSPASSAATAVVHTAGGGPSHAQISSALKKVLGPAGKLAKIAELLKHGGYTFTFPAPSAGRLVIDWYFVPAGAHVTRKSKPKPVLVASVTVAVHKSGKVKVKLKLTSQGRKLLKRAVHEKLTVKASFAPAGHTTTRTFSKITLKR